MSHELVESITLKVPIGLVEIRSGYHGRSRGVPKITLSDKGIISSRANINYENSVTIKNFVHLTLQIVNGLQKGRRPTGYTRLDQFVNISGNLSADPSVSSSFPSSSSSLNSSEEGNIY